MKQSRAIAAVVAALGGFSAGTLTIVPSIFAQSAIPLVAAVRSATFAVENMTCALCPATVKKAMEQVNGVQSVEIDFDAKTATVVFDPAATSVEAIAAASTNAGYPAAVKG